MYSCTETHEHTHIYMCVQPLWIAASEQCAYQSNLWQATSVKNEQQWKKKCHNVIMRLGYKEDRSSLCDLKRPHLVLIALTYKSNRGCTIS